MWDHQRRQDRGRVRPDGGARLERASEMDRHSAAHRGVGAAVWVCPAGLKQELPGLDFKQRKRPFDQADASFDGI